MKTKIRLAIIACSLISIAALAGCSVFSKPVPSSKLKGSLGGQSFSFENPKDTTLTNLSIKVGTNGTAEFSLGYLTSVNNSNVITAATQGQADTATAIGTQIINGVNAGAAIAGKVIKTP